MGERRYSFTIFDFGTLRDGDERSASRPGRFTPGETAPGTHCIGDWENIVPVENQTPAVQPVARRYTDWAIP
jgi:hypothetical protein